MPEQRGEQERRRYRLARAHPRIGSRQRRLDEPGTERLLQNDVEQRQQPVRKPVRAQALQGLDCVAGKQQLLHFVEQPRRRHVLDGRASLGIGAAVFGLIATPTFAASLIARSMRTGSSRNRVTGAPMSFSLRARTSVTPPT